MDGVQKETTSMQLIEEAKMQTKQTMTSQFGLLQEAIILPPQLNREPKAEETADDIGFRERVQEVLPTILPKDGRVLILENIATQHAVATTPAYLEQGIDSYFTFIPEVAEIKPDFMRGSYYHPEKVMDVALANRDRINEAKSNLTQAGLRGVRVAFDPHARFELEHGLFDKFFPSEDKLRELGIKKIVMMGEFPPKAANGLIERRVNKKEDGDKSPIYNYLRTMKGKGYEVGLVGLDTRNPKRQ